jgi:8-oxo-dGTP diphosphatase
VSGPLSEAEYHEIFRKVPRLTVEIVVLSESGVLLTRRVGGPCAGLWNLPGGTVRFAEPLTEAIHRVALDEIGRDVAIEELLGYIEYPSHAQQGIDWPVGIAFRTALDAGGGQILRTAPDRLDWFHQLPEKMHEEQRAFLRSHGLVL